ncbi:MAG: caspase family protein [Deltaproteobacteria bacterium]|nr:caspase family protein [Deltaproteobacteria bacterium]
MTRVLRWCLVVGCIGCGGAAGPESGGGEGTSGGSAEEVRLQSGGQLTSGDAQLGESYVDEYVIPVEAGERLIVDLSSESFDPVVRVTPPGGQTLTDDDHEGSRARSQIEMAIAQGGSMKVEVTSHTPGATGAYQLRVLRVLAESAGAVLTPGTPVRGTLDGSDEKLPDGRPFETYSLNQPAGRPSTLQLTGDAELLVMDPAGRQHSIAAGTSLVLSQEGAYRLQLIGRAGQPTDYQLSATAGGGAARGWPTVARDHHRFPTDGTPTQALEVGSETTGQLAQGGATLPSGENVQLYRVPVQPGQVLGIDVRSSDFDTYLMVVTPSGAHAENDDSGGGRDSSLTLPIDSRGDLWVVVTSYESGETGAFNLKVSQAARPATTGSTSTNNVRLGGELGNGDETLDNGAFVDRYTTTLQAGQQVAIGVTSSAFDTVLHITGPDGQQQTNDDIDYQNDNTNSLLQFTVRQGGVHRVAVTSYSRGESGGYELTSTGAELQPAGAAATTAPPPASGNARNISGELQSGDQTLSSGEFVDTVELDLPAHTHVSLHLTSTAFDTYLAVASPSGQRNENDDVAPNDTNSALEFRTEAAGRYQVFVTSYRPGETGAYQLVAQWNGAGGGTGGTTAPSTTTAAAGGARGSLQRGDQQLQSGEYYDEHSFTLEPGRPAQISATSTAFDTYLIVQTPSGQQLDNDDVAPNDTNSRVEIPSAEAGTYRVLVTSYRPGETGAYQLSSAATGAAPSNTSGGRVTGGSGRAGGGGRVFGIFTGISDYPGNGNDLPECANDAIKLAETLRETGMMTAQQQVVLTDSQATRGAVEAAFRRMAGQMGPNDTFIFFYSGHGGQRMRSTDARELDGIDETLVLYDGEVVDDDVAVWFDSIDSLAIVALDACFAGGFAKDVISRPGRMGLFSSQEDVLSAVAAQFQAGGYLSHFLRMAFRGDADHGPRDGVLTAGELGHFVYNQFGSHVRDVQMEEGWQHAVIERGGVRAGLPLLMYR